jgi:KDO2-lipid IV(A) lauroyltransferase
MGTMALSQTLRQPGPEERLVPGLRWLFQAERALAGLVPLELGYLVARPVADAVHALWRSKREAARRNYARLLHRRPDDPQVRRLARASFRHFAMSIAELLLVHGWTPEDLRDRVTVHGEEHLWEAQAHGRGTIFVSAHMGSTEVASALLLIYGHRVTSVMNSLRPLWLHQWVVLSRAQMGVTLLPPEGTGLRLLRELRRNGLVALVLDLGVQNGDGRPVSFFGHRTFFPTAPARLARLSGAPIVLGLAVRQRGGRFTAYICPPVLPERGGDPEEDAYLTTQRVVQELERFVARYPAQWYPFRDMFPAED